MNDKLKATICSNLLSELQVRDGQTISKTIYLDERLKILLFGFAAGQELSEHTAAVPAILHFLSGNATLTLGNETLDAQAGTFVHMPAHLPHSITAKTETQMLLFMLKEAKS